MMASEGDGVFDLEGRLGAEVVHQVLADARKMTNHGYPELLQVVFRAYAGEHQQVCDLIAPVLSTTRSASTWNTFPPLSASTPTALPSLITIFRTNTPPRTVRFR